MPLRVAQVVAVSPSERRMYYHSFCAASRKWTVGLATSRDGISWRKQGPIFSGGPDGGAFDGCGAAACHVVRDGASRKCALASGQQSTRKNQLQQQQPLRAGACAPGALLALALGCLPALLSLRGCDDQQGTACTQVWLPAMAFPPERCRVTRQSCRKHACQSHLGICRWVMFYEAVAPDNRRSISMAVSGDGRGGWRRLGRPILEAGPQGAWDGGGVGAPCPVSMAGRYPCPVP